MKVNPDAARAGLKTMPGLTPGERQQLINTTR
jgi:hypothetical protein